MMGLRKLTQWEETVAKQEQKQFRLMNAAIVCVLVMCAVLWLVQDKLYGDVVQTGAFLYFCIFIGVSIVIFLWGKEEEKPSEAAEEKPEEVTKKKKSEKRKKLGWVLVWIFLAVQAIVLKENRLIFLQLFFANISANLLEKKNADCDENCLLACMVILMTVMILVGTFVGVKLMGLITLPTVEKKIAAEGFTDVEYDTWMYDRWLNQDENNDKKYYVFQAKKDGQTWQIAADPKGGRLVQITEAED